MLFDPVKPPAAPGLAPPSRVMAIAASLLCAGPFNGLGLLFLGRPRRFGAWLAAGLLTTGLFVGVLLTSRPGLALPAGWRSARANDSRHQ